MIRETPSSGHDPELLIAEVAEDFLRRIELGENPSVEEYVGRYPALAETLRQVFTNIFSKQTLEWLCLQE